MEQLIYYQGDDIPVQIELFEDENQTIQINIDNLTDLVVYVYTDGTHIAKISKTPRAGYIQLRRIDEKKYSCMIDSLNTKLMNPGIVVVEINTITSEDQLADFKLNKIGLSPIGYLNKTLIKRES